MAERETGQTWTSKHGVHCDIFETHRPSWGAGSGAEEDLVVVIKRASVVVGLELLSVPVGHDLQGLHVGRVQAHSLRRTGLQGPHLHTQQRPREVKGVQKRSANAGEARGAAWKVRRKAGGCEGEG